MSVAWKTATDPETGALLPAEYVGEVKGEPEIKLYANRYGWHAEIRGVEARRSITQEHDLERAARRRGVEVDRLQFAQDRAEAWIVSVLRKRDEGGDGVQ